MPEYGSILSKALQLFRDGPTREHLLSRGVDPRILDSSYLAASVSGRADETSYELAGENNGMLDIAHSTSWLAVPTRTSGDIVLGFFVEELLTKASLAILGEQHRVDFSRFAYRDNEFLNIVQKPDIDCVEIFHMSTSSLSVVTVNNLRLSLSEFRAALRASSELNVNSLSAAVHFCTSARYSRCCLVCGASPGRACGCTLPSANLIAPVDIGAFPRNAPQFLGDFSAAGHSLHVRNLGKLCQSGPLLSRLAITPTNSPREKLLYMVAVRAGIVSVDRPMLPLVEDTPSNALGALQGFNVTQGMQLSRETAELCGSPDSTIQSDPLSLADQDGSPLADLEPLDAFIDTYSERISSESETATEPVQEHGQELQDTAISRVTPIAPRADARDIPDELLAHLTAQEEKRLKRMQKNRESAARSNLKRKQKRLQLQSDLANAKEKVEELRAIEVKLRKENRGLRLSLMSPAIVSS